MPDLRRQRCRPARGGCGRYARDVGPISWSGLCGDCGPRIFEANADGLHYHEGPWFHHWRRAVAASVGAVLVDDFGNTG